MIAEILCVGTELLMGQVLNTNACFLSRRLAALGVEQYHQTVVGDNLDRLLEALRLALSRADVVITSGGLGPTVDDITKKAAAMLAGQELVLRPEAESMVRARFAEMHREMTPNNLSQAMFTPDTQVLPNAWGTAPGAIVPMREGRFVVHLPGPPRELEPLFTQQVEPWLAQRTRSVMVSRYLRIFGMGEAAVDERLADLETGGNPTLAPYCSTGEVLLRATASAPSVQEGERLLEPLLAEVRRRLGPVIYAVNETEDGSMAAETIAALRRAGWLAATAESLTGGMIAAELVSVPGASEVVRGGFVTYQEIAKTKLVDVPAELISACGVVSPEVARAMAEGARKRLDVQIAVSATGLAGPGGGTPECPVGTVFLGISTAEHTYDIPLHLQGSRERIRALTAKHAMNALRLEAERAVRGAAD